MRKDIKSRLVSLFGCFFPKWLSGDGRFHSTFVLPPLPNHRPFSDAELAQCRDALSPLGYTAIRRAEDHGIQIYRQVDWQEQKKAMELVLQKLKQDV